MKLKPFGNIVKCNHCNERFVVYIDVFRCLWCSYYSYVVGLHKTPGRHIYPPTLLDIANDLSLPNNVTRLPYYEPDDIKSEMHDPKYDSAFVSIGENTYQKKTLEGVE